MSSEEKLLRARVDSDTAGCIDDLETSGYCLLKGALDSALLERITERLRDQAQAERRLQINYQNPAHVDVGNQWVNMLLNKGDVFRELALEPLSALLVEHLLGPEFLLSACDAQIKHPRAAAMPLHSDQWWLPKPIHVGETYQRASTIERNHGTQLETLNAVRAINPPVVAVVMWMISDFTEANGATRVVPRSHLTGAQPDPTVPYKIETVATHGEAGTALVFDGRTWHGAGANNTEETRYAITCGFAAPQFRTLENYPRALRPEVLEHASAELLHRIGFRSWGIYGHTGDPSAEHLVDGNSALGELGTT